MANQVGPNDHNASYWPATKQVALGIFRAAWKTLEVVSLCV